MRHRARAAIRRHLQSQAIPGGCITGRVTRNGVNSSEQPRERIDPARSPDFNSAEFLERLWGWGMSRLMKKGDRICPDCKAGYRRMELQSRNGMVREFRCSLCDCLPEITDGSTEIAYRLTVTPENLFKPVHASSARSRARARQRNSSPGKRGTPAGTRHPARAMADLSQGDE